MFCQAARELLKQFVCGAMSLSGSIDKMMGSVGSSSDSFHGSKVGKEMERQKVLDPSLMAQRPELRMAILSDESRLSVVPDLNKLDHLGMSVLHRALSCQMRDVALAVVQRNDFKQINAKRPYYGATALHLAAFFGYTEICESILARPDFTQESATLQLPWYGKCNRGDKALMVARRKGHFGAAVILETSVCDVGKF